MQQKEVSEKATFQCPSCFIFSGFQSIVFMCVSPIFSFVLRFMSHCVGILLNRVCKRLRATLKWPSRHANLGGFPLLLDLHGFTALEMMYDFYNILKNINIL